MQTAIAPKPVTVQAVLAAAHAADKKLQALSPVFARLAESLGEVLKSLTPVPVKVSFDGIESNRGKAPAAAATDPMLTCALVAEKWDSTLTLGFDRNLLFAMTEAMFGGNGQEKPYAEERPISNIEKHIAKEVQTAIIRAMATTFQAVAETTFRNADASATSDTITPANVPQADVVVRFLAHLWSYSGEFQIGFPKPAILMLIEKLRAPAAQSAAPRQSAWTGHIQNQISDASVQLTAILSDADLTLDELANLKKGQVIKLTSKLGQQVKLMSDGEPLFNCDLGQSQGRYVLSIDGPPGGG